MSTFKIETNPSTGKFDDQYPIHLEGLVTQQEFAFIIEHSNSFLNHRRSTGIWFWVIMVTLSILSPFLILGGVYVFMAIFRNIAIMLVGVVVLCAANVVVFIGSIFWIRNKFKKYLDDLKAFLEFHNQQTFIPKGVQFLAKSSYYGNYDCTNQNVYLEVIVASKDKQNVVQSNTSMNQYSTQQQSAQNVIVPVIAQPGLYPNVVEYQRVGNQKGGYLYMK